MVLLVCSAGVVASWLWTVETAPAGSTAQPSDPAIPDPTFTPDLPGEFILTLTAGDGAETGDPDRLLIYAFPESYYSLPP